MFHTNGTWEHLIGPLLKVRSREAPSPKLSEREGETVLLSRSAAGVAVALGAVLAVPTAAQALSVDTSPGDHFSKTYWVDARTPFYDSDLVKERWTIKRKGKVVEKTKAEGWWLEPGKYKFEYVVSSKNLKSVRTLRSFEYTLYGEKCSVNVANYVSSQEPKRRVKPSHLMPQGATDVQSFAEYHPYGYRPGGYYYDKNYVRHEITAPGPIFDVSQIPEDDRGWFEGDESFIWVPNGGYAFATYRENQPDVTASGTVSCGSSRYGYQYRGDFMFTRPQSYFDLGNKVTVDDISSDTPLQLTSAKKTIYKSVKTKVVKARNGAGVTAREARAIRVGMSKSEVHRIFGTSGTQMMKADGFETREYDDWVYIGYVNGRVNSIQRY